MKRVRSLRSWVSDNLAIPGSLTVPQTIRDVLRVPSGQESRIHMLMETLELCGTDQICR